MLREAPKPEAVPNKTLGEVEPAGAAGEVGDDQRLQDTKHGPADAVQELGGNDERRLGDAAMMSAGSATTSSNTRAGKAPNASLGGHDRAVREDQRLTSFIVSRFIRPMAIRQLR